MPKQQSAEQDELRARAELLFLRLQQCKTSNTSIDYIMEILSKEEQLNRAIAAVAPFAMPGIPRGPASDEWLEAMHQVALVRPDLLEEKYDLLIPFDASIAHLLDPATHRPLHRGKVVCKQDRTPHYVNSSSPCVDPDPAPE